MIKYNTLLCFAFQAQAAPVSAWEMKLGIHRELGLYADSIADYGAFYKLYNFFNSFIQARLSVQHSHFYTYL